MLINVWFIQPRPPKQSETQQIFGELENFFRSRTR